LGVNESKGVEAEQQSGGDLLGKTAATQPLAVNFAIKIKSNSESWAATVTAVKPLTFLQVEMLQLQRMSTSVCLQFESADSALFTQRVLQFTFKCAHAG
jgi:hypothetical protein